jgi:HD-GYP domain-containing protein (c-di-GMP phosphodiesterase class II)/pSer/pThr/pTyr-binding forkhead associated (FHA) protein
VRRQGEGSRDGAVLVAGGTACKDPSVGKQSSRTIRIVLIDPEGQERTAVLQEGDVGPITLGRAPENDIQVISPYVSRRHAQMWPHEDGLLYEDLASTSGSYIGGARIDKAVLEVGQGLRLGSPDGLPLRVEDPNQDRVAPANMSRTEILRVADIQESLYLTGDGAGADDAASRREKNKGDSKMEARLRALISLTGQLLEISDRHTLADVLLERVFDLLPVDRGMILLVGKDGLEPIVWGVQGERDGISKPSRIGPLDLDGDGVPDTEQPFERPELPFVPISTVTNRVFQDGVGLLSLDASSDQRLEGSKSVVLQAVRSIMCAPIASAKTVYGVVYVDTHRSLRKEDEDALDWLVAVTRQAGMVLENITMLEKQRGMLESTIRALAASIDARDGLTAGHSARVAHYSVGTAEALGLSEKERYTIYYAALLHDYGKIGVDDAVLKKPGRLTPEEYEHIKLHPKFTFDILSKIEFPPEMKDLALMAASHHERMDGEGYPWGLAGDEIPIAGRIMAIADVYDSLTRKRHYREPMPMDEVLAHLEEGRGPRFDPEVLDAFFRYHSSNLAQRERRRMEKRQRALDEQAEPTHRSPITRDTVEGVSAVVDSLVDRETGEVPVMQRRDDEATIRVDPLLKRD